MSFTAQPPISLTILRRGDMLLVDATTGHHLWAERYDRPLQDIFGLQDEIVQQIIANLRVEMREVELARVRRTPTDNLTAYDYVLRGCDSAHQLTPEANAQARQMYEQAITLDPYYAVAYEALAWTYWLDWAWWSPDLKNRERAFELAQKALALDDALPGAHGQTSCP
jgi:adenylate cyclase